MAHHVFRRGLVAAGPYADIEATNPTLFVPLKYASTSADGQILYQDSGATTPVTAPGDPVGAVKFGGSVIATQPTNGNRPVWQGSSLGTQFTRASEHYLIANVGAFLTGDTPVTVLTNWNPDSYGGGTNEGYAWGLGQETEPNTSDRRVAGLAFEAADRTAIRLFGGNAVYDPLPLTKHVATARYQGGGAVWELFEDGVSPTLQSSSAGAMNFTDDRLIVGADPTIDNSDRPAGTTTYDGHMKAIAVYDSALTGTDRTDAEDALGGL